MNQQVLRFGRQVAIAAVGGTVVIAGIALALLPVLPGFPLILLGVGILSLVFKRPRALLARLKARAVELKHRFDERRSGSRDGK
jgi:uncharacterized membrane protein YbaN (DUF454 family)